MAGHVISDILEQEADCNLTTICFRKKLKQDSILLDVRDTKKLEDTILAIKPNLIINAIGILIKGSMDVENAISINALLPHSLSRLSRLINSKLIHISTDCVFSGEKGQYSDISTPDAMDVYGRTKSLGEIKNTMDLTIRTSIIGPELKADGEGLFHWIATQNSDSVNGFTRAFWSGITTLELAKAIQVILGSNLTGIYNLTNGIKISKYELLRVIVEVFDLPVVIIPSTLKQVDKTLISSHRKDFSYRVPSYKKMITDLFNYMQLRKDTYQQYSHILM